MADNVGITTGTDATVAADEVGGAYYQRVKISVGADGAASDLAPGQAAMAASVPVVIANNQSAVPVSLATAPALVASEALVGLVGASDLVVTVTPTVDTNVYASGDLLFDSAEVANAVRVNGYCCILESITIIDKADQKVPFTLLFANAETDFGTLNSAPDPDDTEAATVIGWVPVLAGDYVDLGGAAVACVRNIGLTLRAGGATTSLYIAAINGSGTPTYGAASDLIFQLGLLRS